MSECDPQSLSDFRNLLIIGFALMVALLVLINQSEPTKPSE